MSAFSRSPLFLSFSFSLGFLWIFAILYVNPEGNFPLDDDWAYAKPVKSFVEQGHFAFIGFPAMTLIGHTLWGTLFCKLLGFSFTVLRFSTLVWGGVGLIGTFHLLKSFTTNTLFAFLATLFIGFNPLYFCLSYSYMTDIPFFALSVWAIYFFFKELGTPNTRYYLAALLFSIWATSIRQPGLVYPFAFAVIVALKDRSLKRAMYASLPFLITLGCLAFYEFYLRYQIGYQKDFPNQNITFFTTLFTDPLSVVARQIAVNTKIALYIGLYLLPLSLLILPHLTSLKKHPKTFLVACLLISCIPLLILELQGKTLPFNGGNILTNLGVGPALLYDHEMLKVLPFGIPPIVWKGVTVLSFFSFLVLAAFFTQKAMELKYALLNPTYLPFLFMAICVIVYIPIVAMLSFYDRYTLPILLFALVMLFTFQMPTLVSPQKTFLLIALLIPFVFFSVSATSTYLNWNRARWQAVEELVLDKHISTKEIDGGFEVNAWYNYSTSYTADTTKQRSYWWVYKDTYAVTFSAVPGRKVLKKYPYQNTMTSTEHAIYVCVKP